ncbi:MAG: tRNA preQ1(34) S-adenosylmethionine ribosyltransferase-isomerase QueA [Spirochaetia bacterium]
MKKTDFSFSLPEELIAQFPEKNRHDSRLMVIDRTTGKTEHSFVKNISEFIPDNSLFIFNNSKVRKARIYGTSSTGGRVEFLLVDRIDQCSWKAMVSKAKKQKVGKEYTFPEDVSAVITEIEEGLRTIQFSKQIDDAYLDRVGHMPLPPYIKREDTDIDESRYQTVYARETGSIAAPTAGLHFTQAILDELASQGHGIEYVTLHVGLGTFLPIRSENITDHTMHTEVFTISASTAEQISDAKRDNRPIIAVGTTSVRALESAGRSGEVIPGDYETDIFIYPGFEFQIVDKMFTNFHTPESTLLLLVSAFAGKDRILGAYEEAVKKRYRFFSYGDAMLIL